MAKTLCTTAIALSALVKFKPWVQMDGDEVYIMI
jgi:hypothetical protein